MNPGEPFCFVTRVLVRLGEGQWLTQNSSADPGLIWTRESIKIRRMISLISKIAIVSSRVWGGRIKARF